MASYHLSAAPIKRSAGRSVVAAAAYRSGEALHDGQELYDYTRKGGIHQTAIIAPEHAPEWMQNREQLWNAVELSEKRGDAQLAREVRLALPCELTDEQRADLVFDFCRDTFVKNGMIADIAIHRPDRHGDQRNHHAHVLLTMREVDGDGFAATKQRAWNRKEALQEWREQWEVYSNRALEAAGSESRIDHRSFKDRGIDAEPTVHLGPMQSEMERRGVQTPTGDHNRHVEQYNALRKELAALETGIAQEETQLSAPPATPEEARARLSADRELFAEEAIDAERLEKEMPADRTGWAERTLLYVARQAKNWFDLLAEKALSFVGRKGTSLEGQSWETRAGERRENRDKGMEL